MDEGRELHARGVVGVVGAYTALPPITFVVCHVDLRGAMQPDPAPRPLTAPQSVTTPCCQIHRSNHPVPPQIST